MIRSFVALALAGALAAPPAVAQDPTPRPRRPLVDGARRQREPLPPRRPRADRPARGDVRGPGMPGMAGDAASMLLAHTGELRLSDQQVTRLAAIARRAGDRRQALRRRIDSLRAAAPVERAPAVGQPLRAELDRMREARRADLRDALAVLTPDQQAQAWELRGRGAGVGARMRRGAGPMQIIPGRPQLDRPRRDGR